MLVANATSKPTANALIPIILIASYLTLHPTPANAVANRKILVGLRKDAAMGLHRTLVAGMKRSVEFNKVAKTKATANSGIPDLVLVISESSFPCAKTSEATSTTGAIMKIRTDFVANATSAASLLTCAAAATTCAVS